jgi:hypothetical protein
VPLIAGYHGREGKWITVELAQELAEKHPAANVAARLPHDIICLDVDDYEGHDGGNTLAALEDELGVLPLTVRSTARHGQGVSGIKWFRVPAGYLDAEWAGVAGPGIDVITWYERYAIVPPSRHANGREYEWYLEDGDIPLIWPEFGELPELPERWCAYLATGGAHPAPRVAVTDPEAWLEERVTTGELCKRMTETLEKYAGQIEEAAGAGGIHDCARDGAFALAGNSIDGHAGGMTALRKLKAVFLKAIKSRGRERNADAEEEWQRIVYSLAGEAELAQQKIRDEDPCPEAERVQEQLSNVQPIRSGLVKPVSSLSREMVKWLWPGYLAFRELTQMDGEKGQGKTFVTDDVAARATLGLPMPGQDESVCGPVNVLILTDEGHANSVIRPRLEAAGADLDRVFIPEIKTKRGKAPELHLLPGAAQHIGDMIAASQAGLVIWDPITDFLDESIQTHNDASVRRALRPMAVELTKHMCAGWAIRHMNKNTAAQAKHRGSGSSAFQNRARIHLVVGRLPESYKGAAEFGLAQVDTNMMRRVRGALTYAIEDSDIESDEQGNMIGRVEWHGLEDIDVNKLTQGEHAKSGPDAYAQDGVRTVLEELFGESDTWPVNYVTDTLKEAKCSTNKDVLGKVCKSMGIYRRPRHKPGGGIAEWVWTTDPKQRLRAAREDDDE